jgi:hypothetical protein
MIASSLRQAQGTCHVIDIMLAWISDEVTIRNESSKTHDRCWPIMCDDRIKPNSVHPAQAAPIGGPIVTISETGIGDRPIPAITGPAC